MSLMKEIEENLKKLDESINKSEEEKKDALEKARLADEQKKKAEKDKKNFEDARKKGEAFEESYNNAMSSAGLESNEKKRTNKRSGTARTIIASVLATTMTLTGLHFIATGIKNNKNNSDDKNISNVQEWTVDEKNDNALAAEFREFLSNEGIIRIDEMVTGRVVVTPLVSKLTINDVEELSNDFFRGITSDGMHDNEELLELGNDFCKNYLVQLGITVDMVDVNSSIDSILTSDEELTTEKFEELVARFAKPYVDNKVSLSTEDLTKFTAIMLIDRLAEENPQLIEDLFSVQSEEEFLNDAGKVIGNTYMYNHKLWEAEKKTDNFIWISEGIQDNDPQKVKMLEIEEYVKRIALAAASDNKEEVNKITAEFIDSLTSPTGSLNSLDDGIEFASQVYIAMINNSIGRNYLDDEYRDYFTVRSSAEANVSNILTVIRGCVTEGKTKSLTK